MTRPELLAPAGGMDQLKAAVRFGADAVYLGARRFGLRAFAGNFGGDELTAAVDYAHAHGVRVYVTVNAFLYDDDLDAAAQTLKTIKESRADAVIVSDIAALLLCEKTAPGLPIHISTQANTLNRMAAGHYHGLGASRIILARELSLERIRAMRRALPQSLELECFVHGAMCASYSGRCVLSNHMADRDANQGECAQPCRWKYALVEEKRPGQFLPIAQDAQGTYIYSAYDLCMIEHIGALAEAGVSSFKIEGRMKSDYYVATVVNAYRKAIDLWQSDPCAALPPHLASEALNASHRPFSTGFYFGRPDSPPGDSRYRQSARYIAKVLDNNHSGTITVEQRNRFFEGDELFALTPGGVYPLRAADLRDETGVRVKSAPHPRQILTMRCDLPVEEGDFLRAAVKNDDKGE